MPTIMPFCVRLTIALLVTVAVRAAAAQDPYAPQAAQPQYAQPSRYSQPPQYQPQPQYPAPQQQYPPQYSPPPQNAQPQTRYPLPPQYAQPSQYQPSSYPQQPQYAPQYPPPGQNAPQSQYQPQPQVASPPSRYAVPPVAAAPVPNQTLRYPLPAAGAAPAPSGPPAPSTAPPPTAPSTVQPANNVVAAAPDPAPQAVLFKPGQIVARVGDKSILYADVAPTVEMRLEGILAKTKTPAERQALEAAYREPLTKNVIEQTVFNKLLLMEFERGIPAEMKNDAKKKKEMEGKLRKQIRNQFEQMLTACRERVDTASPEELEKLTKQDSTMVRLAVLMKERHLESYGELDKVLKEYGTSLEQQVKDYGEYMMGMEAARSKINGDDGHKGKGGKGPTSKKEVTYDDLRAYYQAHLTDYYIPAKARFEILTAKFVRCSGDRQKTRELIEQMGNEVLLGGTPLPAVARKNSQEPHASDGGYYDWVTPGSLASKPIDQAVFTLEVDKLSQIIEDEQGFHIIHVLERKDPGQISFQEAQPKIRETIESQRKNEFQQKFLADVRTKTKIWTIYDPPEGAAQPAAGTAPK